MATLESIIAELTAIKGMPIASPVVASLTHVIRDLKEVERSLEERGIIQKEPKQKATEKKT